MVLSTDSTVKILIISDKCFQNIMANIYKIPRNDYAWRLNQVSLLNDSHGRWIYTEMNWYHPSLITFHGKLAMTGKHELILGQIEKVKTTGC